MAPVGARSGILMLWARIVSSFHLSRQGLRHADENGGGGGRDQAAAKSGFSSEGNPYQKPKTQRIWPTVFLKMGGLYPALSKMGGRVPPPSPLWRSPCFQTPSEKF